MSNQKLKSRVEYLLSQIDYPEEFLKNLTKSDDFVKEQVISSINDEEILLKIALILYTKYDVHMLIKIIDKIENDEKLLEIVNSSFSEKCRNYALSKITNQEILEKIALESKRWILRYDATKKLERKEILEKVAESDGDIDIKTLALRMLYNKTSEKDFKIGTIVNLISETTNQKILANFANIGGEFSVRLIALKNLKDKALLKDVIASYIGSEDETDEFWHEIFYKIQELDKEDALNLLKRIKENSNDWYINKLCEDMLKDISK